jgi:Uncharacterised nucleotidyltransferase
MGAFAESTASNLLLEAAAGEVVEALRLAGLRSVLFKGPTTARWLYKEDPCVYADVDLLVDPARFEDCERVLEGLGFERSLMERRFATGRPGHASTWTRGSVTVDLHRTLVGPTAAAEEVWAVLSAQTETWTVGRAEVEVLEPTARSLVLALHAAQHGPEFARTADDLERAIAQVPTATWVEGANLARALGAEAAMAAGLHNIDGGRRLCEMLGLRLDQAAPREGSTSFHVAQGLLWLVAKRGVREKAAYVWMKLFPPPSLIRSRVPWARSGRVALALAYCVRLGRALLSAPRAVWALTQLHRERRGY